MNWFGTAYALIPVPVPAFFVALDKRLDEGDFHFPEVLKHPTYIHGANLCRRMGDVDLYAHLIERELNPPGERNAVLISRMVGSLLVGHYSTCKAVPDAAAIALTTIYQLGISSRGAILSPREMDFSKGKFWAVMRREQPALYNLYVRYRPLVDDIVGRRDAAIHRLGPLVTANNRRYYHISTMEVTLATAPDARSGDVDLDSGDWVDPLHFHRLWRPDLLALCEEVCRDLAEHYDTAPPPPPPPG